MSQRDVRLCRTGRQIHCDGDPFRQLQRRRPLDPLRDRIVSSSPWTKEVAGGRVTYTLTGEQGVFDLATGLPLLYEAGLSTGSVGHREVFRVER